MKTTTTRCLLTLALYMFAAGCGSAVTPNPMGDAAGSDGSSLEGSVFEAGLGDVRSSTEADAPTCEGLDPAYQQCPKEPGTCGDAHPNCAVEYALSCVLPADHFPAGTQPHILCNTACVYATWCPAPPPGAANPDLTQCRCGDSPWCGNGFFCVSTPANPAPHCECSTTYARL